MYRWLSTLRFIRYGAFFAKGQEPDFSFSGSSGHLAGSPVGSVGSVVMGGHFSKSATRDSRLLLLVFFFIASVTCFYIVTPSSLCFIYRFRCRVFTS